MTLSKDYIIDRKPEVLVEDLLYISPHLGIILYTACAYAQEYNLPIVITSIWSDRKDGCHADRRGVDLSLRGWSELHYLRLEKYLNKLYGVKWGTKAIGSKEPTRVALVHESKDSHGNPIMVKNQPLMHLHLQCRAEIIGNFI